MNWADFEKAISSLGQALKNALYYILFCLTHNAFTISGEPLR
jgi:hypothetical protein